MRLARLRIEGTEDFAVGRPDGAWVSFDKLGLKAVTTGEAISAFHEASRRAEGAAGIVATGDDFLAPVHRPSKMLAIGLNYMDHIRETGSTPPERPVVFAKYSNAITGPTAPIVMDGELTNEGDYESELAVIIGQTCRRVDEEAALDVVFGYAVANDVSARDWQRADSQFSRSKGMDTFCPIGPWITTADEISDPNNLMISSRVNGEMRQSSTTAEMIFGVKFLIAYLSRTMTLEAGDVVLTGTPHGVGFAMNPKRYLVPGDRVECEIEGLGQLDNPVVGP